MYSQTRFDFFALAFGLRYSRIIPIPLRAHSLFIRITLFICSSVFTCVYLPLTFCAPYLPSKSACFLLFGSSTFDILPTVSVSVRLVGLSECATESQSYRINPDDSFVDHPLILLLCFFCAFTYNFTKSRNGNCSRQNVCIYI